MHNPPKKISILSGGHIYTKTNGINVGDIAQLEHALYLIKNHLPTAEVTLISHSINDTTPNQELKYNSDTINYITPTNKKGTIKNITILCRCIKMIISSKAHKTFKRKSPLEPKGLEDIKSSNALLITGSGTLCDQYWKGPALIWSVIIICAGILNIPIILLGQQIGPLNNFFSRRLVSAALKKASFLGVRDLGSGDLAISLGVSKEKVFFTGDEGLYLPPATRDETIQALNKSKISNNFIAVQFRLDKNCPFHDEIDEYAGFLDRLSSQLDAELLFVPLSYANNNDDRSAAIRIAEKLHSPHKFLDAHGSAAITKGILSHAKLAVGVANHFCVFAASVGTPTIGVYKTKYMEQKLKGVERTHNHVKSYHINETKTHDFIAEKITPFMKMNLNTHEIEPWKTKPENYYKWLEIIKN